MGKYNNFYNQNKVYKNNYNHVKKLIRYKNTFLLALVKKRKKKEKNHEPYIPYIDYNKKKNIKNTIKKKRAAEKIQFFYRIFLKKKEKIVLQKIKSLPFDIIRHIKNFIQEKILVKSKLNIKKAITFDKFFNLLNEIKCRKEEPINNWFGRNERLYRQMSGLFVSQRERFWMSNMTTKQVLKLKFRQIELEKEVYDNDNFPKFIKDNGKIYDIRDKSFIKLLYLKIDMKMEPYQQTTEYFQNIFNEIIHPSTYGGIANRRIIHPMVNKLQNYRLIDYEKYTKLKKEILDNEKKRLKKIINKRLHDQIFGTYIWQCGDGQYETSRLQSGYHHNTFWDRHGEIIYNQLYQEGAERFFRWNR